MSAVVSEHDELHLSYGKYITGFLLSILSTVAAYLLVTRGTSTTHVTEILLACLAAVQFIVQLVFFLHVGEERKPRWRQLILLLMIFFAVVVVLGSVWIMYNLNYRMSPQQMNQYMQNQTNSGL